MKQKQKNKSVGIATKTDLNLLENSLRGDVQKVLKDMSVMRKEHKQYKDEVLTKLDDISGQLENLQEDKTLSIHQTSQLEERTDNHEKRISRLEKIQQAA